MYQSTVCTYCLKFEFVNNYDNLDVILDHTLEGVGIHMVCFVNLEHA